MTTTRTTLLVGWHFHPPAKLLLEHLPAGASLRLTHDDENPYDERAISVWVNPGALPAAQHEELRVKLPGMGFDLDEVLAGPPVMLGYVAASEGKPLEKARVVRGDLVGNAELFEQLPCEGRLAFDGSGMALVIVEGDDV